MCVYMYVAVHSRQDPYRSLGNIESALCEKQKQFAGPIWADLGANSRRADWILLPNHVPFDSC